MRRLQGDLATAHQMLTEAITLDVEIGHRYDEAQAREELGLTCATSGRPNEAITELVAARAIFQQLDHDAADRITGHLAELGPHDRTESQQRGRCGVGSDVDGSR
jgi:hypothetical protein